MGRSSWMTLGCMVALAVAAPGISVAEEARLEQRASAGFAVGVEGQTSFPMLAGGRIWAELPGRLRLSTSLGIMPASYGQVVGSVVKAASAGNELSSELVLTSLDQPLFWGAALGWRPSARHGFYLQVGYALGLLSGQGDTRDLAVLVNGKSLPASLAVPDSYAVSSRLHMVTAELGWQVRVWRGITIRAALGGMFTVGAETQLSADSGTTQPAKVNEVLATAEQALDDAYTSYVFTPTLSLALGWQVWPF